MAFQIVNEPFHQFYYCGFSCARLTLVYADGAHEHYPGGGDAMAKKMTIRDVAQLAGVSIGTASRVINRSTNVDPKLRESVERAILQIGFEPNAAARSIRNGSSRVVGILISDITLERLAIFSRNAQMVLEGAGYAVFIACHENRPEREMEILKFLSSYRVEGLIRCHSTDLSLAERVVMPKIPTVVYDRDAPEGVDTVKVLHGAGVRRATELLLELGHRSIALVTGPRNLFPARDRIDGYRGALETAGIAYDPSLVTDASFHESFLEISGIVSRKNRPTAIVLGGTSMLPDALTAIRGAGLRIPEDLSLVASTDTDLSRLVTPPVTVVRWDSAEVGRTCARVLLKRLQEKSIDAQHINFAPELVARASCAPPPRR
jgi:LacI family transcriptional regulator